MQPAIHQANSQPPHKEPRLFDRIRVVARRRGLARKTGDAYVCWARRFILFPSHVLSTQPETGRRLRHHLHASKAQRTFKQIRLKLGITKDLGPHCLRHSFATHLHDSGVQIRKIQKLLGHQSLNTTMIYTHISSKPADLTQSPLDRLSTPSGEMTTNG